MIQRKIVKYQRDEVYIGSAEEREAKKNKDPSVKGDDDEKSVHSVKPGHLYPGVPTLPPGFGQNQNLTEVLELEAELLDHQREIEARIEEVRAKKSKLMKAETENDEEAA